MYYYIYDSFLSEKKYEKLIDRIEARLANLGIAGKKERLTILKSVTDVVENVLKKELPKGESVTIVVVGHDETFCQAAVPMAGKEVVLGFIPTKLSSPMADILGLPVNEYACDVISARLIEKVSFGQINGQRFFSSLKFPADRVVLTCDGKYQIIPKKVNMVKVMNIDLVQFKEMSKEADFKRVVSNPKDDYLEVLLGTLAKGFWFLRNKEKRDSLFFVKRLKIESKKPGEEVEIKVDATKVLKTPALVELAPERLKLIVGKDRLI